MRPRPCGRVLARALVLLASCGLHVPARAETRPVSADRPDRTESAYSVPAGYLQVEADAASVGFTREGGDEVRAADLATVNLKLGLHRALDLQLVGTTWSHLRVEPDGLAAAGEGRAFPALAVRLKWNLAGNDGGPFALGVLPYAEFAREGGDDPLVGALVPVALALPGGNGLGAMAGFESAGGDRTAFIASATVARDLAPRVGGFLELFGAWEGDGGPGAVLESTFDWGVTFEVTESFVVDAGAYHGLGGAAEDVRGFVGLTWRGRPWRR